MKKKKSVVSFLLLPILFLMGVIFLGTEKVEAEQLTGTWSTTTTNRASIQTNSAFERQPNRQIPSTVNSRYYRPAACGGLEITKYDSQTNAKLAGAQFTIYNNRNQAIQVIQSNREGIAESRTLANGYYSVRETKAPDGYQLESSTIQFSVFSGQIVCLKKANTPLPTKKGSVKITKVNEKGQVLSGAEFDVFNSSNQLVGKMKTGSNGVAELSNLPYGTYKIVETKAPAGYELDATPKYVTINQSVPNGIACLTICNKKVEEKKGSLEIIKKGDNGQRLAGAKFAVLNSDNVYVSVITTDSNGVASLGNLPYGTYRIVETLAPAGYELDATPKYVTISKATPNGIASITIYNKKTPKGKIQIVKKDDCGSMLAGAEFDVFNSSNQLVGKIKTGTNGIAELGDLPYGTYKIVETKAPAGYELDATPKNVTISKATPNGIASITIYNKKTPKGKIQIVKKDDCGSVLSGAEFDVFNSSNQLVGKIKTGTNGVAELGDLPYGTYKIVETKAPAGYELDATPKNVTISKATLNGIASITIFNKKIVEKGSLEVIKKDEDGQLLVGAQFIVMNSNNVLVGVITTGTNGVASLGDLPFGTYKVIESKAPAGYELDTTPKTITISGTNKKVVIEVPNKKVPAPQKGSIKIVKYVKDSQPVIYLKDAVFAVYDEKDQQVGTYTTDANGEILITNLDSGKYYVIETKAPTGYELDTNRYEVNVNDGKTVEIKHANVEINKTGCLKIKKFARDKDGFETNNVLSGAVYKIIDSKNQEYTATTNANGEIFLPNLPIGEVKIQEIKAPGGYSLNDEIVTKTIEIRDTTEVILYNQLIFDRK